MWITNVKQQTLSARAHLGQDPFINHFKESIQYIKMFSFSCSWGQDTSRERHILEALSIPDRTVRVWATQFEIPHCPSNMSGCLIWINLLLQITQSSSPQPSVWDILGQDWAKTDPSSILLFGAHGSNYKVTPFLNFCTSNICMFHNRQESCWQSKMSQIVGKTSCSTCLNKEGCISLLYICMTVALHWSRCQHSCHRHSAFSGKLRPV